MTNEPIITLSIREIGSSPSSEYLFNILLDGKPLSSNQSLSATDSRLLREISRNFSALFEQDCMPEKGAEAQWELGKRLFDLWLASSWEKIVAAITTSSLRFLVIASESPEILNLPWELLLFLMASFSESIPSSKSAAFPVPESSLFPLPESCAQGPCGYSSWHALQMISSSSTTSTRKRRYSVRSMVSK